MAEVAIEQAQHDAYARADLLGDHRRTDVGQIVAEHERDRVGRGQTGVAKCVCVRLGENDADVWQLPRFAARDSTPYLA